MSNYCKNCYELTEQLDQLKAENEQYKSSKQASYEEMQKRWNEVELENRKLKQANDEKNDLLQKLGISATGEFKRIKYYIDKLVMDNDRLINELNQLKQTLTEIKEIIHFNKTNRLSGGACISIEQILEKISEVV